MVAPLVFVCAKKVGGPKLELKYFTFLLLLWNLPMSSINFETGYLVQTFLVIFSTLVAVFLKNKGLNRLHSHFQKTKNPWDEAFIKAISSPIGMVIGIVGIAFACEIIQKSTEAPIFGAVKPIRAIGVIAVKTSSQTDSQLWVPWLAWK